MSFLRWEFSWCTGSLLAFAPSCAEILQILSFGRLWSALFSSLAVDLPETLVGSTEYSIMSLFSSALRAVNVDLA